MVLHGRVGLLLFVIWRTNMSQQQMFHNNIREVDTLSTTADFVRHTRDKRAATSAIGSATLKGMIAVKTLIYKAKKLPYPHSKRFVIKYEKPGGKKRLQEDFSKVKYDETRDFYMKNGNWGVMGSVGDRVVIAIIGGNGEKPTLRIVKAADLDRHLRNKQQVMLPREEIIYTTGNSKL